jgi:hypothetical protein
MLYIYIHTQNRLAVELAAKNLAEAVTEVKAAVVTLVAYEYSV